MIRPGPDRLAPRVAPGGLVLHVYDADGRLLLARALGPDSNAADAAAEDADRAVAILNDHSPLMIVVVYDGDTGERHPPWVDAEPGTRLT